MKGEALKLDDPLSSQPSAIFWPGKTNHEALLFSEFDANSRFDQPFLDHNSWRIREDPHFQLATCKDEQGEIQGVWERLSEFHGAKLVDTYLTKQLDMQLKSS